MSENATPRTDEAYKKALVLDGDHSFALGQMIAFAEGIERELSAANARIAELERENALLDSYVAMFNWLINDPSLACLIFAESTNPDSYPGPRGPIGQSSIVQLSAAQHYILDRITELMSKDAAMSAKAENKP